jgi:hypothetical protein
MRPLRDQWGQLKGRRRTLERAQQSNAPDLDVKKQEFDTWYAEFEKRVPELIAKANAIEDEIYHVNQPKARKYELVRVN